MVGSMNAMAPNLSVQGGPAARSSRPRASACAACPASPSTSTASIRRTRSDSSRWASSRSTASKCCAARKARCSATPRSAAPSSTSRGGRRRTSAPACNVRTGTFDRRDLQASVDVPLAERVSHEVHDRRHEHRRLHAERRQRLTSTATSTTSSIAPTSMFDAGRQRGHLATAYDRSDAGPARAAPAPPGRSARRTSSRCRTASVFNTNPHAQAYENAFGILYDDFNVVLGLPRRPRRRVRDARRARHERLVPRPRSANVRRPVGHHGRRCASTRSPGDREQDTPPHGGLRLRLRACSSPIARTTTRSIEDSYELQFGGTHGDRDQFNWIIGYYANDRSAKSRVPTFSGIPFTCDLLVASTIRGVTDADRAECFNNRMRALNVQNQFVATPQMTAAQIRRDVDASRSALASATTAA